MREDIKTVISHFKHLYKNAKDPKKHPISEIVAQRRNIVEKYGSINNIDPTFDENTKVIKLKIENINCEWIIAPESDPNKRLLYLHGGAFIAGSLDSHRALCAEIAKRASVSVLVPDYRLAPENPFPAGLNDCFTAYNWMLENSHNGKEKANKIFIAGDSAGGNLSLALTLKLKAEKITLPNAVLPVSPVLDLSGKSPSVKEMDGKDPVINRRALVYGLPPAYLFGKEVLGLNNSKTKKIQLAVKLISSKRKLLKNPFVSPLYGDLRGLPPIFINAGEREILRDDSVRFAKKAKEHGVEVKLKIWPEMMHVFIAFLGHLPESDLCLDEMSDFIKKYSQ